MHVLGIPALSGIYIPGTPGASWTDQDLFNTKQSLISIMDNPKKALKQVPQGKKFIRKYKKLDDLDAILPTAAKIVRLGFHDCLPESDTGAGCNGCFNFNGVKNKYFLDKCVAPEGKKQRKQCKKKEGGLRPDQQLETDNNNLFWTAQVLEGLYYGYGFDGDMSLYESGKSRADLWAYAALVAVRHTLENNNDMCESYEPTTGCPLEKANENFCAFNLTTPDFQPVFRTGRSDCIPDCGGWKPDFCTTAHEVHPNPHSTGNETGEFMKNHFGLNVQVALQLLFVELRIQFILVYL